jgi:hypothetical protein
MCRFRSWEASRPLGLNRSWLNWVRLQERTPLPHLNHCRFRRHVCRLKMHLHSMIQGFYLLRVWDSQTRLCEQVSDKNYIRLLALLPSTEFGPLYLGTPADRSPHNYCVPELSHKALKLHLLHFKVCHVTENPVSGRKNSEVHFNSFFIYKNNNYISKAHFY